MNTIDIGRNDTLLYLNILLRKQWGDEVTEPLQVKRGKVLWHNKDRDEVYYKARELRPKHSAILYTGRLPEGAGVVL